VSLHLLDMSFTHWNFIRSSILSKERVLYGQNLALATVSQPKYVISEVALLA